MKYCKLGKELTPIDKFEEIKCSIFSLFSHKDEGLKEIYRNSLNILYKKTHDSNFIINKHLYPIESTCLKELSLIKDDNTLECNVKIFVNYLIGLAADSSPELLDKPIYIIETPLIQIDTA